MKECCERFMKRVMRLDKGINVECPECGSLLPPKESVLCGSPLEEKYCECPNPMKAEVIKTGRDICVRCNKPIKQETPSEIPEKIDLDTNNHELELAFHYKDWGKIMDILIDKINELIEYERKKNG